METVGQSGPESALLLVRIMSVNTCQGRKTQNSQTQGAPTMYLENAQIGLIVGTLTPNMSPVDLEVCFNVSWQRQTHCNFSTKKK